MQAVIFFFFWWCSFLSALKERGRLDKHFYSFTMCGHVSDVGFKLYTLPHWSPYIATPFFSLSLSLYIYIRFFFVQPLFLRKG